MATNSRNLAWRTSWTAWKGKIYEAWRWAPRLEGIQYATRVEHKAITNSSRKNEVAGPKWKWCLAVNVSGGESKIWCSKEQYCIGTWNVRSMDQGKLDVVKQEMARLNINIVGFSELKWMKMSLTPLFFSVTKCAFQSFILNFFLHSVHLYPLFSIHYLCNWLTQ